MSTFKIIGGKSLKGNIKVKGAKNLALKLIAASLLAKGKTRLQNVPDILDIRKMIDLVVGLGVIVNFEYGNLVIDTENISSSVLDRDLVRHFRGSIVLVGPLLSRFKEVTIAQPGGCLIGARPIDTHLKAFEQLGIKHRESGDNHHFSQAVSTESEIHVCLDKLSVTATENVIMASVIGKRKVSLRVAAVEPEIGELIDFLNKMGAKISGRDTHFLTIEGVEQLEPASMKLIPDRIEAATLAIIGILTKGEITIENIIPGHLDIFFEKLRGANANFEIINKNGPYADLRIRRSTHLKAVNIDTRTYPGFSTDLQSPFAVLMTQADGVSQIFETLYEGRFNYLKEIASMGASVSIQSPHIFIISGPTPLYGKEIKSLDIRGGAAVMIAALIANGITTIEGIEMIDRGYERIDERLNLLGAKIERV